MARKRYRTSVEKRARDARYRVRKRADQLVIAAKESGDTSRIRAAEMYRQHVYNVVAASLKSKPVKLTQKAYNAAVKRDQTAYRRDLQTFLRRAEKFTTKEAEREIRENMIGENRLRNPSTPKEALAGKLLYSLTVSVWQPAEAAGIDRDQAIVNALGVRTLSEAFNIVASRINVEIAQLMEGEGVEPNDYRLLEALKNWKSGELITGDVSWEEIYHLLQNMPEIKGHLLDLATVANRKQHRGLS